MQRFDECFEDLPDPRADNALHDLAEILFIVKRTAGGLLAKRRFKGAAFGSPTTLLSMALVAARNATADVPVQFPAVML
ncbi:hypothetical protein AB7M43_008852 [Bradyrhizobium elkanii]